MRRWIAPLVCVALAALLAGRLIVEPATPPDGGSPPAAPTPAARSFPLERGINIDVWLRYGPPNDDVQPGDLARIRALGFSFVRLPVGPDAYQRGGSLDEAAMARLDAKLDQVLASGLAAIVDLHPREETTRALLRGGAMLDEYVAFVEAFARHLATRDPAQVALEMLNEPHDPDPDDGVAFDHARVQARLWAAARAGAPELTLVATGPDWSSVEGLETLTPLPDRNVVYDVHLYTPVLFTHQGATWTWSVVEPLRGVPYPASPETVAPLVAPLPPDVRPHVVGYGEARWDRESLAGQLDRVRAWSEANDARVMIGEFGAYKTFAPPDDRARWVEDVRELADERGIPWAMWEWDRRFGLYDRATGEVDPALAAALGLGAST